VGSDVVGVFVGSDVVGYDVGDDVGITAVPPAAAHTLQSGISIEPTIDLA